MTIVNLIAVTMTGSGLKVSCELDQSVYLSGNEVSKQEMEEINLLEGFLPRGVE